MSKLVFPFLPTPKPHYFFKYNFVCGVCVWLYRCFCPAIVALFSTTALRGAELEEGADLVAAAFPVDPRGAGGRTLRSREAAGDCGGRQSGRPPGHVSGATRCPAPVLSRLRAAYHQVTSQGEVG